MQNSNSQPNEILRALYGLQKIAVLTDFNNSGAPLPTASSSVADLGLPLADIAIRVELENRKKEKERKLKKLLMFGGISAGGLSGLAYLAKRRSDYEAMLLANMRKTRGKQGLLAAAIGLPALGGLAYLISKLTQRGGPDDSGPPSPEDEEGEGEFYDDEDYDKSIEDTFDTEFRPNRVQWVKRIMRGMR